MNYDRIKLSLFTVIGILNTLVDMAVYTFIRLLGGNIIVANVIAVSIAMVMSYMLNSKYTFKAGRFTYKSFAAFVIVTVFGLLVLQTGVIYLLSRVFKSELISFSGIFKNFNHIVYIVTPKAAATAVSMVWNFVWYNKIIFKPSSDISSEDFILRYIHSRLFFYN